MHDKPYSYIDVHSDNQRVYTWTRDTDHNLLITDLPVADFCYCFMPDNSAGNKEPEYRNLYGHPMKRVEFKNPYLMRQFAQDRKDIHESDVAIAYKVINDLFRETESTAPVHVGFYDIEVDFDLSDGLGYPKPNNPYGPVNAISLYDRHKNTYAMFLSEELKGQVVLEDDECPVEMHWCFDERHLLQQFAKRLNDIDVITGWFSDGFDLPYLMARAEKLLPKSKYKKLFCRDDFDAKYREYHDKDTGQAKVQWSLIGRQHVDLLDIFKKFNPGQRDSWSLDAICETELDMNKVQYEDEGDLGTLYRSNPQKFFEYSLHDVRLLKLLDDRFQLMPLAIQLGRSSYSKISDISGSVKPIENSFMSFCKDRRIVLPNRVEKKKAKFPGAIVYDTKSGIHKWIFSADLASLYPSTIMLLGLSNETMSFQCLDKYNDYVRVITQSNESIQVQDYETGDIEEVTGKELNTVIKQEGWSLSANGTIFNGKQGLIAEFVEDIVERRKSEKNIAQELSKAGREIESQSHDLAQKVLKIRANSIYGCMGNESFRLFDLNMAASITQTARMVSRFQAFKANRLLEDLESEL